MRRLATLVLSTLMLASMAVVPLAQAESSATETDFNATVNVTLTSPGQFFNDGAGNRYYQGLVYTGQLSGSPVSGTLRIDANVSFEAGSSTGQIDGSYVISDGSGNSFHGDLSESRVQESGNGLLIAARLNIEGGTGLFNDATGNARIAGNLPMLGVSATAFNPAFGQQAFGQPYAAGTWGMQAGANGLANGNPWQLNPNQPMLAISGTLALNESPNLGSLWNQNPNNQFNFGNRDNQQQFRDAIRDFNFNANNNFNSNSNVNSNDDNVRPGNGWGDRNHEHTGSQNSSDNHNDNRGSSRGRGRGNDKD